MPVVVSAANIARALPLKNALSRIAYDRLVADFEALECVRARQQERKAGGAETEPPDGDDGVAGAVAAEAAAERYLSALPAAQQTRESVRLYEKSLITSVWSTLCFAVHVAFIRGGLNLKT